MKRKLFEPGEKIFAQGDPSDRCYQIFRGTVTIILSSEGKERVVSTLGRGDVFGEMGIIDSGPRSASAIASEETVCVAYSADEILEQLESNPEDAIIFMKALVRRLRETNTLLLSRHGTTTT